MPDTDELAALLQPYRTAHLATADAAAVPHVIPICFVYDGRAIYSAVDHKPKRATGYRMKRIQNILANPHVAFIVDHYDEDWEQLAYVLIRGTASVLENGAERQHALHLLEAKYSQYLQRQLANDTGLVVKIVPETVRHWTWHKS